MTDEKVMSERSIRFYLQTSPGFLGRKKGSERFKVIINNQTQQKKMPSDNGQDRYVDLEQFDNPFCFDYRLLQNKFELNLETRTVRDGEEDDEDQVQEKNLPF
jgi:hypothetical protein